MGHGVIRVKITVGMRHAEAATPLPYRGPRLGIVMSPAYQFHSCENNTKQRLDLQLGPLWDCITSAE